LTSGHRNTDPRGFAIGGLNHLGLVVDDIAAARRWFVDTLGLKVLEDRGELLFIMAGRDVLAVKTPAMAVAKPEHGGEATGSSRAGYQSLDHYGFYASTPAEVDAFARHVETHGAKLLKGPYDRSDGRSVYFKDPLGLVGEFLYFNP
jgi:catechol 2,3-dioxygenase-like lactoylglutathione lyase family enzyme